MDWLHAVILALVQGLTEFLPVSSSAHLILVPVLTDWQDQGLAFDVALHMGSLAAVVIYFRQDLLAMWQAWWASVTRRELSADGKLAWAVILGTIPVGLAGLMFKDLIETVARSPVIMAWSLIGFGLLLAWADWRRRGERNEHQMTWKDVAWIALAQALALIPGTSRSGITMTAGLLVGLSREASARFSFLLSIPVIVLAGGLEAKDLIQDRVQVDWAMMALGTLVSGLSAYACIHYFLAFIKRIGMQPFVIYRVVLGVILLAVFA